MAVDKERTLKLHLKNFQAFDDLDVEFVQGVNTIIGESNSGKKMVHVQQDILNKIRTRQKSTCSTRVMT